MKTIALLLVALVLLGNTHPANQLAQCTLAFEAVNAGFTVSGTISAVVRECNFDPAEPSSGNVIIVADPTTIDTGIEIRDKHLQRSDYFDTQRYPLILLESVGFKKHSRKRFTGTFRLTMKSVVKEFDIPFTLKHENNHPVYHGSFMINRMDFGVGGSSLTLSEEVAIHFSIK